LSSIVLTAAVRANLLALRDTSNLLSTTQERLATGKRVNSALDNPSNFFTAQALGNRAGDLNALLDQIGQAQQTLHAADNGITALTKLVQAAKSIAEQAKQTPGSNTYGPALAIGTADVTPQPASVITGAFDLTSVGEFINGLVIRVGGVAYPVSTPPNTPRSLDEIISDINGSTGLGPSGAATASKDASGHLVLTSNSAATITVDPSNASRDTGLYNPNLAQVVPGLSGTDLTVTVPDGTQKTIRFGTGANQVSTYGDLMQAIGGTNVFSTMQINHIAFFHFGAPGDFGNPASQGSLTLSGTALGPLGFSSSPYYATPNGAINPTRAALAQQYNAILQQIDQLAGDASYNGTNLLQGGNLNVPFNEAASSSTSISGVIDNAAGLGLSAVPTYGMQTNADVDCYIGQLTAALGKLRTQAAQFGSSLSTVQIRQDFTKQTISTLQSGVSGLTLADTNQEGANLLALQTRQQLATTALSLAAQSDQSVLKLFR